MLRYVKFHPKQPHCEHCNAGLLKGAVELSDGKKYGRDCAARAMGKPRESASMKKAVDDLRKQAIRIELARGYRDCQGQKAGWTWQSMGYGGNIGWPLTHHYRTQTGDSVLEIFGDLYDLGNPKASKVPAAARPHLITLLEGAKSSEARQPRRPVVAERMDALLLALKEMRAA